MADALLDGICDEEIAKVHARMQTTESEGQRRMLDLHGGSRGRPRGVAQPVGRASGWPAAVPAPRWWAATPRWPTASRSTPRLGIDEFILSGYPHLEELYWFGEGVLPILEQRGAWIRPEAVAETMRTGSIDAGGVAFGVVPDRR